MTKLLVLLVALLALLPSHAAAQSRLSLVIAIDLTESVNVHGPDQATEFQKNLDGVTRILAKVPASSRITIVGITDQSFSEPDILLSAMMPDDPGYFGERLSVARTQLVQAWKARSSRLEPRCKRTDIGGALILASQIFGKQPGGRQKTLIIFSDMRNTFSGPKSGVARSR